MLLKRCTFTDTSRASCNIDLMHTCLPEVEGHGRTGSQMRAENTTLFNILMNKQFLDSRNRVRHRGNERGSLSLRHCFLQHKCCIITTLATKTDSHKCEMSERTEQASSKPKQTVINSSHLFFSLFI